MCHTLFYTIFEELNSAFTAPFLSLKDSFGQFVINVLEECQFQYSEFNKERVISLK